MQLENDLYGIDKKLLIKARHVIDSHVLENIAGLSGRISYVRIKDTPLMKDIIQAFEDKRYSNIFFPQDTNLKIIRYISHLTMPEKILSELAHMKKMSLYTYHHILIISILATKISLDDSQKNKYSPEMASRLNLLHDLGKTRIPLRILNKRSPLTKEERHILNTHPLIGYILLHYYFGKYHKKYDFSAYQHHERLDGSGYPLGIKRLNKYSHLIGIVDTLDALISERPYRKKPFSLRAALDFLLNESEKGRFNEGLVQILIRYARKEGSTAKLIIAKKGRDKEPTGNSHGKTAVS